jgi:hypothetical protein
MNQPTKRGSGWLPTRQWSIDCFLNRAARSLPSRHPPTCTGGAQYLDVVAGALDVLPSMPLDDSPHSQRQKASGTDGTLLVPMLVPNAGNNSASGANADNRRELCGAGETPISDAADGSYQELPSADTMKALGLEPRTYGLKGFGETVNDSRSMSTSAHVRFRSSPCRNAVVYAR